MPNERLQAIIALDGNITLVKEAVASFKEKKVLQPQTIYAGTGDNIEFFKQIATAFGISENSYSINLVDGEYEIIVKNSLKAVSCN